jgi:hypothetical protein
LLAEQLACDASVSMTRATPLDVVYVRLAHRLKIEKPSSPALIIPCPAVTRAPMSAIFLGVVS